MLSDIKTTAVLKEQGIAEKNEIICSWFIVGLTQFVASENMIGDVSDFICVCDVLITVQSNSYTTLCKE